LDRPWLETPFALQGFRLCKQNEIEQLRGFCKLVYVDCVKSAQEESTLRRKVRNRPRLSTQKMFHDTLLKQVIQAVGIYPAGTLAELTNGEAGVVTAEHRNRRLRPRVRLLLDGEKQPVTEVKTIDPFAQNNAADGKRLDTAGSLQPDAYGLDMTVIAL
jgi:hypothetical protein